MIPLLASWLIRGLHASLRLRHVHAENLTEQKQCIIAFWHAHLLLMLHTKWRGPAVVMISRSRDGEYIARVFDHYGVESARGSSTRGGSAALRELIRAARAGKNIVFTPDGPKGPNRIVKDGIVAAAQATGLPIVPIAFAAKKKSCCAPGTAWSSPCRSRGPSSFTGRRSSCRATRTSRRRGRAWRLRCAGWKSARIGTLMNFGESRKQKAESRNPGGDRTMTARISAFCLLLSAPRS